MYDPLTGGRESTITVPKQMRFPSKAYFWTTACAQFVVSRHLEFNSLLPQDEKRVVLVFEKR